MTRGGFLLLAGLLLAGCGPSSPQAGSSAPDFQLSLWEPATSNVQLAEINRDHPVLLVFWASWCPGCLEEIPQLNSIQEKFSSHGLRILAVNVQETRAQLAKFQGMSAIRYPVALDGEGNVASLYGIVGLPAALLLAKGGEILYYGFSLPADLESLLETRSAV